MIGEGKKIVKEQIMVGERKGDSKRLDNDGRRKIGE